MVAGLSHLQSQWLMWKDSAQVEPASDSDSVSSYDGATAPRRRASCSVVPAQKRQLKHAASDGRVLKPLQAQKPKLSKQQRSRKLHRTKPLPSAFEKAKPRQPRSTAAMSIEARLQLLRADEVTTQKGGNFVPFMIFD
jgi:hypothetical protein